MRRWLIKKTFGWMTAKFVDGDCELVLKLMADDVRFVFPGTSSFAADITGKAGIERWLRRFVAMHPSIRDPRRSRFGAALEHPAGGQDPRPDR